MTRTRETEAIPKAEAADYLAEAEEFQRGARPETRSTEVRDGRSKGTENESAQARERRSRRTRRRGPKDRAPRGYGLASSG